MCMQRPAHLKSREHSNRPVNETGGILKSREHSNRPVNGTGGICQSGEEAWRIIREAGEYERFSSLPGWLQEEMLSFMMGRNGLRIMYDPFFKMVFDPVLHPERLSRLLSLLLGEKVTVKQVLPQESRRLSGDASLVIMDIVVELEDGSYANVEIQKVGYDFPGQRSACYSSDLVMRQYVLVKSIYGKKFSYRKLKKVYTIVLMENSSSEFNQVKDAWIHHAKQVFDTGLKLDLLQEYVFVALDIFKENVHNIDKELDAWLYFLSSNQAEDMKKVIEAYPSFLELYQEIAAYQTKPEELIYMFSEALAILDKNTMEFMVEEREKRLKEKDEELKEKDEELKEKDEKLRKSQAEAAELRAELARLRGISR